MRSSLLLWSVLCLSVQSLTIIPSLNRPLQTGARRSRLRLLSHSDIDNAIVTLGRNGIIYVVLPTAAVYSLQVTVTDQPNITISFRGNQASSVQGDFLFVNVGPITISSEFYGGVSIDSVSDVIFAADRTKTGPIINVVNSASLEIRDCSIKTIQQLVQAVSFAETEDRLNATR